MHIYFSGIGGAGIGPLALIAKQAGYEVSGSDKQESGYTHNLRSKGLSNIHIGQDRAHIAAVHEKTPIDWFVYSSAILKENPHHPEYEFAREHDIRRSKRDELLDHIIKQAGQNMIAIAGTHGKTTTTAMVIWLFKQLDIPISYSVGGKLSFGGVGEFEPSATYFVYEADEYDRNFLSFQPAVAIISGIAYDHPDIYPTKESYDEAFAEFICGTGSVGGEVYAYAEDLEDINLGVTRELHEEHLHDITLAGVVNRRNALLACNAVADITHKPLTELITIINQFPGLSRRFEQIADNLYTDYAHTPEKIEGALQLTREIAGDAVVVVYEGLHNTRQHFILEQLKTIFDGVIALYVVPSYRAREDESLEDLTPEKLCKIMQKPEKRIPSNLDETLKAAIENHLRSGQLVLALSAGGGGSLDEWLRAEFTQSSVQAS